MDMLTANIVATCPAFSGAAGEMFARAVTAVVAAHCAVFNDQWPIDNSDEILRATESVSYDFIVVGAGTAGSLVAGKLAKSNPTWSILLIEVGGDPSLPSEVPLMMVMNFRSSTDWAYQTQPDGKSCLGYNGDSCLWSKGKGLGGSSSINEMIYTRGHPNDYDEWEYMGNVGWGYDDVKPYFEKIEEELQLSKYEFNEDKWYDTMTDAWQELGLGERDKANNEGRVGTGTVRLVIKNGTRLNTAKSFLNNHKNLHIIKNTAVQKVIIDPERKTAIGVEIRHVSGVVMNIAANKEVILSAGSIGTPQVLMLSGVGPKRHLEEKAIDCFVDLPVGLNLQDHVYVPVWLKMNYSEEEPPEKMLENIIKYMVSKSGPFANIGITDYMTFVDTNNKTDVPNIQYHHLILSKNNGLLLKPYLELVGFKDTIADEIIEHNRDSELIMIYPTLLRPKSIGEVLLNSNNINTKPLIKANYFEDEEDVRTLIESINLMYKLEKTKIFKDLGLEIIKLEIPGCLPAENTARYWECYMRHLATTLYHPVGTTKMGPKEDERSVVNNDLEVHGLKNLRVVDAGVMPVVVRGNTMATTLMIAEKAVDAIKRKYLHSTKEEL